MAEAQIIRFWALVAADLTHAGMSGRDAAGPLPERGIEFGVWKTSNVLVAQYSERPL